MNALDTDPLIDSPSSRPPRRSRRRWLAAGAAAVALAGLTAGLAVVTTSDEPSEETVRTSVEDSPPPPPFLPTAVHESTRLQLHRLGPVQVGMTLDEASAAAGRRISIDPRTDLGHGCAHARGEGDPEGVRYMVLDGRIARIEVFRGPVATVEGVTIGSAVQDVLTAYAGRIRVEPHAYTGHRGGQYLIYDEATGVNAMSMLFETDGSRVTQFRSGLTSAVMAPEGCA